MPFQRPAETPWFSVDPDDVVIHDAAEELTRSTGCDFVAALRQLEPIAAGARRLAASGFGDFAKSFEFLVQTAVRQRLEGGGSTVTLNVASGQSFRFDAGVAAATGTRTFSGIAYSGGIVPNHYGSDMAIDLASMTLPSREVPILLNHDHGKVVGRAGVMNDGRQLVIQQGHLSEVTAAGREVASLIADGHPWCLSVGVNARSFDADRRKPTALNGRLLAVDSVLRNARLLEVSFVPAGADPDALVH